MPGCPATFFPPHAPRCPCLPVPFGRQAAHAAAGLDRWYRVPVAAPLVVDDAAEDGGAADEGGDAAADDSGAAAGGASSTAGKALLSGRPARAAAGAARAHFVVDAVAAALAPSSSSSSSPSSSSAGFSVEDLVEALAPEVLVVPAGYAPTDPLYGPRQAAHYEPLGVDEAWDVTGGHPSVVVQVTDGGIDEGHEDMLRNKWRNPGEADCGDGLDDDGNGYVDDCQGYNHAMGSAALEGNEHGAHVAGLVAATTDNGLGVAGVCGGRGGGPGCSLMVSTVFGRSKNGGYAEAMVYGADHNASVSSNSWVYGSPGVYDPALLAAIDYAVDRGVLVVFAAGNNNRNKPYYPAVYEPVLAVGAVAAGGAHASYSNFGDWVDVSATGDDVWSTSSTSGSGYSTMTGTSQVRSPPPSC